MSITQLLDAIHWIKYLKFDRNIEIRLDLYSFMVVFLHLYSLILPILSLVYAVMFALAFVYWHEIDLAVRSEWKCLLCLCLGVLVQFIHTLFIHSHLKQKIMDNLRNLGFEEMDQQIGNIELNQTNFKTVIQNVTDIHKGDGNQISKELL